jgi:hypothetical protein
MIVKMITFIILSIYIEFKRNILLTVDASLLLVKWPDISLKNCCTKLKPTAVATWYIQKFYRTVMCTYNAHLHETEGQRRTLRKHNCTERIDVTGQLKRVFY